MSRSKKHEGDYDDIEWLDEEEPGLDELLNAQPNSRRRKRRGKYHARQRLDELEEARWLRRHISDWDSERFP